MATESSAIVRLARLAQARPIAEPPSNREATMVVRLSACGSHRAALLRRAPWVIAAAMVAFALVVVMPAPSPGPLRGPAQPVAMPLQEPVVEPVVEPLQERGIRAGGSESGRKSESAGTSSSGDGSEGPSSSGDGSEGPSSSGDHGAAEGDADRGRSRRRGRRRSQVAGFGTLQVGSKPPCHILIDGRDTGLTTPQRSIRLRPGRHRIGLRNLDHGIDERFVVRIRDGRTTKVIRDLTDHL